MLLPERLIPEWAIYPGIGLLALVVGAIVVRAFILYRRLQGLKEGLYPVPLRITAADELHAQQALGTFESVSFRTKDGLDLQAWRKPSQNGTTVIFIHGKSNNRCVLIEEAAAVSRQGMGVLLYDSRASGESDGYLHSWGYHEQLDLVAALDFLESCPDVDSKRIGVHGFSVGANTALMVGVNDDRIKAVILSGPSPSLNSDMWHISSRPKFLTYWFLLRMYRRAGVPVKAVCPIELIAQFSPRSLMMIRGTGSVTTPVVMAQLLFERAKQPKELYVIEGADHNDYFKVGGQPYLSTVADFFRRQL